MTASCSGLVAAQSTKPDRKDPRATVTGRCVDEAGKPIADGSVWFFSFVLRPGRLVGEWGKPKATKTDKDGRFRIRFWPQRSLSHELQVQAQGRLRRKASWRAFQPGQVEDLGNIRLPEGAPLKGVVVDAAGMRIRSALVALLNVPGDIGSIPGETKPRTDRNRMFRRYDEILVRTSPDGSFVFPHRIPKGKWVIRTRTHGLQQIEPADVDVDPSKPAEVRIVVREAASFTGRVVDEAGRPVAGVLLERHIGRSRPKPVDPTDKDGWFRFYIPGELPPKSVYLHLRDPADCDPLPHSGQLRLPWGREAVIRLRRSLKFELRVVEAGGKRAVQRFAIKCYGIPPNGIRIGSPGKARLFGPHKDGKVMIDRVWRGRNRLVVIPEDPALAIHEEMFIATEDDPGPERVVLRRLVGRKVQLRNSKGEPLANHWVQVIDPRGQNIKINGLVVDHRDLRYAAWSSLSDPRWGLVISSVRTNAGGHCVVYGDPLNKNLVRVLDDRRALHLERDVRFVSGGASLRIKIGRKR